MKLERISTFSKALQCAAITTALFAGMALSGAVAQATGPIPVSKPALPFSKEVLDLGAKPDKTITPPISYDPLSGYQGQSLAPTFGTNFLPYAPPSVGTNQVPVGTKPVLYLVAKLAEGTPNLTRGLKWRVYSSKENADGSLNLVASSQDQDAEFRLDPGTYLVHTSFGNVTATTRYELKSGVKTGTIILNAGGIRLDAALGSEQKIPREDVVFNIYDMTYDATGNRSIVASGIKPGELVPVSAGTYHVESRYGTINAVVRADIHVQAGKLTEATLHHQAGNVTLKLVSAKNKTSLANTSWTILSPGGDTVASGNGAFLDLTLAAGTYTVMARNSGDMYRDEFTVSPSVNKVEVEVLTKNPM
ncbi:hypothetical protein PsAD2_00527 [Pseudovibrio axinellae]|uniref:Uncharacterized protein n=1 Tax=Pseudovibrio axinellae TaxID=989403 RepID=A0A166AKL7_9HYPH|nr:hypothetical protein [Pseudovibrio axinellae]KZL21238.1 hypothetical protein PsAD2_00527 [Pseudovibrio axinellae]SEQ93075.1 hypothetical protein SAMN05421798_105150 [Pseudovibrio axinellae]